MRIIQTVNDTIRLLFNPKTEVFCLSDFLLVRDVEENFLAQIVEVYDDKFDQEANVAKIKLIYRIINGNELVPYDNYTPSRECEVAKIKQSEIEKCINLNKKTIIAGKSAISGDSVEINTNFFENNCVIFADKYEQTNKITECLAPRLSKHKNVLILDFSGSCDLEGAEKFISGGNFKMPLSADTIDYIQQKTLLRAKLETQVVLGGIFEEVKNFLSESQEGYIPFSRFIKVIQNECSKEPSVELLVLISWLRKYARLGLFAKSKKEFEPFFKSLAKNKLTTLDVSNIKTEWQKEFVEYVINNIQNDVYVLIRLNDNNINNDILNSIYLKKKNISFIPSFAYGYKKASYIMEFAQNYILLPTLNPKRDFNHANFQIQSLNNESFILFGEDTKDFIFVLELKSPIKKFKKAIVEDDNEDKDKLFISLNLQLDEMAPLELIPSNFELKKIGTNRRRMQEEIRLSDVLKAERKETKPISDDEFDDDEYSANESTEIKDTALISMADEDILGEDELDYFDSQTQYSDENNDESSNDKKADELIEKETEQTETQKTEQELMDEIHKAEEDELIQEIHKVEEDELIQEIHQAELNDDGEEALQRHLEEAKEKASLELANEEIEEIEAEIIKQAEKETEEKVVTDEKSNDEPASDLPKIKEASKNKTETTKKDDETIIADSNKKNELLELAKENEEKAEKKEEQENKQPDEKESETKPEIDESAIDDNILDAIDEVNGIKVEPKKPEPEIEIDETEDEKDLSVETISIEELVEQKIQSAKNEAKQEQKADEKAKADEIKAEEIKKEIKEINEAAENQKNETQTKKEKTNTASNDKKTEQTKKTVEKEPEKEIDNKVQKEIKEKTPAEKETENKAKEKKETKKSEPETETETETETKNKEPEEKTKKADEKKEIETPKKTEEETAIDKRFDEILSDEAEAETKKELLQVDEKNSIDLEKIKEEIKKPEHKLPVFDDENSDASGLSPNDFKEGDIVSHNQYGKGNILKVIKHGTRCLLQIEFPEAGVKRLLDPKIAKLTIVKEN